MHMWSAWKLWSRLVGPPAAEKNIQAVTSDDRLTRALHGLRHERAGIPSWHTIERLIHTGKKEQSMAISRASVFAFSRHAAVIAAASLVVVLAFFTVPFSQTSEVGSNIIFKFDPPLENPQSSCDQFANAWDLMGVEKGSDEAGFGMAVKVGEGGLESLEVTALAESGMSADEIIAKLKNLYPVLEQAEITINPITEHSKSTMFGRLLGEAGIRVECEGKTAEEIKAEIESILEARGMDNPQVQVIKSDTDGKTMIKICAPAGGCGK